MCLGAPASPTRASKSWPPPIEATGKSFHLSSDWFNRYYGYNGHNEKKRKELKSSSFPASTHLSSSTIYFPFNPPRTSPLTPPHPPLPLSASRRTSSIAAAFAELPDNDEDDDDEDESELRDGSDDDRDGWEHLGARKLEHLNVVWCSQLTGSLNTHYHHTL